MRVRPALPARRSYFWPGFVAGFVLLSLLACGALALMLGFDDISLADLQTGGVLWTPPASTPTSVADEVQAGALTAGEGFSQIGAIATGVRVRNATQSRVNIRRTPGYQGKPGDDVPAQLQPGDTAVIASGPVLADGLVWWEIQSESGSDSTVEGWVAEATAGGVAILAVAATP